MTKFSAATILSGAGQVYRGAGLQGSSTDFKTTDNLQATTRPGATDDANSGYHIGSFWFNSTMGQLFICRVATASAAIWDQISTGGISRTSYPSGNYVLPLGAASTVTTPGQQNTIVFAPITSLGRVSYQKAGLYVVTTSAINAQIAFYNSTADGSRPTGAPIKNTGNISLNSAAAQLVAWNGGGNLDLEPGTRYWVGINFSNTTSTVLSFITSWPQPEIGSATLANLHNGNSPIRYITVSQTFGTWPTLAPGTFTEVGTSNSDQPMLICQYA